MTVKVWDKPFVSFLAVDDSWMGLSVVRALVIFALNENLCGFYRFISDWFWKIDKFVKSDEGLPCVNTAEKDYLGLLEIVFALGRPPQNGTTLYQNSAVPGRS